MEPRRVTFCTKCQFIFVNDLDDKWINGDDCNLLQAPVPFSDELIRSSREDCFICKRVYEEQSRGRRGVAFEERCNNWAILSQSSEQRIWFELEPYSSYAGQDDDSVTVGKFVIQNVDQTVNELGDRALGSDYNGSEDVLTLAKHWLRTCLKPHKKCAGNLTPAWYATRLLQHTLRYSYTNGKWPAT
jgi:hypothetical protein